MMRAVSTQSRPDPLALEAMWRALETRADLSFFQSWTWMGCLYEERFPHPLVLSEARDGATAVLGLFNRGKLTLHLGESGVPDIDSIYIEHNGLVWAREEVPDVAALLRAARAWGWLPRRIVLSGVDDVHLAAARAAGGRVVMRRTHIAPVLDLTPAGVDWMLGVSTNTRQQLRRSSRAYATQGTLRVERAEGIAQAHSFLEALAVLHQRSWVARGEPGAFARPFFRRFHRELIARGLPRDEIDLLRISAGDRVIGYLYNFRYRGRVLSYQGGFDYDGAAGALKPGMTCHHLAIDRYAAMGVHAYDFLAGDDRYKRSLANARATLHWLTLYPPLPGLPRR